MNARLWGTALHVLPLLLAMDSIAARSMAAESVVDLELVMAPGFPPVESQRWIETLKGLGFEGIRLRSGRPGDKVQIESDTRGHRVMGVLTRENSLQLPAGSFKLSDREAISKWLAKLKSGGEEGLVAKQLAFGLSAKELVAVQEALASPVEFNTRGEKPLAVAEQISKSLKIDVRADAAAQKALTDENPVADEFKGMAAGTALVALVRPLGLVAAPKKEAGEEAHLLITSVRSVEESWPVGWPLTAKPAETLPALLNFLDVEIKDIPLREALNALQGRLQVPFVYDYNALVRNRIDLEKTKVNLPAGKSFYQRILDRVANQALLKAELRLDDANRPFFWITTQRP